MFVVGGDILCNHLMLISFLHLCCREQPIFSCKAHVFHIDPKTKRSWIPASSSAVSVSFFHDSTRQIYRIISVEGPKVSEPMTTSPLPLSHCVLRYIRAGGSVCIQLSVKLHSCTVGFTLLTNSYLLISVSFLTPPSKHLSYPSQLLSFLPLHSSL